MHRLRREPETRPHADGEAATTATVRDLLADIVQHQLVADIPLCSLLSGGVDSSAPAALAARSLDHDGRGKLELAANVPFRGAGSSAAGTPADRNVELRITPPFPLVSR